MVASSAPLLCLRSGAAWSVRNPNVIQSRPVPVFPATVGLVAFRTHRGEPASAILDATGHWRCPEMPVLDRVLNALFRPGELIEPDDPEFGQVELGRVAAWIKGEIRR